MWFRDLFQLKNSYHANCICFRCNASRTSEHGVVWTHFGAQFHEFSTMTFINHVLPAQPSPLILLEGFNVRFLRFCLMHVLNLGIYQVEDAEGLLWLAQTDCLLHENLTLHDALKKSYNAFRRWCTLHQVKCSVRPWKLSHFHLGKDPLRPTQHPWINFKAYNARCVLAWLAEA